MALSFKRNTREIMSYLSETDWSSTHSPWLRLLGEGGWGGTHFGGRCGKSTKRPCNTPVTPCHTNPPQTTWSGFGKKVAVFGSLWHVPRGYHKRDCAGLPSQSVTNLRPVGVGREGDEKVRLPHLSHNGHAIVVQLLHVPRPSSEGRRKDHPLPDPLGCACRALTLRLHRLIRVPADGVLVRPVPCQSLTTTFFATARLGGGRGGDPLSPCDDYGFPLRPSLYHFQNRGTPILCFSIADDYWFPGQYSPHSCKIYVGWSPSLAGLVPAQRTRGLKPPGSSPAMYTVCTQQNANSKKKG